MGANERTNNVLTKILRIDDPQIINIPDLDNQEPMVSLLNIPRLLFPSQIEPQIQNIGDSQTPFVRSTVKEKILTAIQLLPEQYSFVLIEAQRTIDFQTKIFQKTLLEIQNSNPELSLNEIQMLTKTIVSDPKIFSPHITGGAIDIAIADNSTKTYLDMGNYFQHDESAATNYQGLSNKQKQNRRLLTNIMKKSGFVNYPREWWHWSYGDKLWAHINHQPQAIYGPINT